MCKKAADDDPRICVHPYGRSKRSSGSSLWLIPALAVVQIWEVNQQVEDISLHPSAFQINLLQKYGNTTHLKDLMTANSIQI